MGLAGNVSIQSKYIYVFVKEVINYFFFYFFFAGVLSWLARGEISRIQCCAPVNPGRRNNTRNGVPIPQFSRSGWFDD